MNLDERLLNIARNRPALAPLALELREKGISPEWFNAYRELPTRPREVLLRAFLGQPYLISNPREQYGSARSYLRLMDAICARAPELVETPLNRWALPKAAVPDPVAAILGFAGTFSAPCFLRDLLFQQAVRPARAVRRHRHYQALARQCRFDRAAARRYFFGDVKQAHAFSRYFQSEVEEVWAPNTIRYLYFFLECFLSRELGRALPKKIPTTIANRFGIPLNSVPDLLAVIDVLYLGANDVLDLDALHAEHRDLAVLAGWLARPAFRPMRRAFSVVGHLTPEQSLALYKRHRLGVKLSRYFTSFLFNLERLFQKNYLRSKGLYRFVRMAPYRRHVVEHFSRYEPDGQERLRLLCAWQPRIDDSLDLRSFVNILIYLDTLADSGLLETRPGGGLNYMAALPNVAKYQFGFRAPPTFRERQITKKPPGKRTRRTGSGKKLYYPRENSLIEKLVE